MTPEPTTAAASNVDPKASAVNRRIIDLEEELGARVDRSEMGFLRDLVVRDISSLQDLLTGTMAEQIGEAVRLYKGFEVYEDRTAGVREIPLVVLSRVR